MFAKIFEQIYDSSIAEDWQTRVVFQDMVILADKNGIVDRTPEAIARRTNIPLEVVKAAIPKLEGPDPSSRTPDQDGRRIVRLDPHRDWGWQIVNFMKYRESATKDMLRMGDADRKRAWRERKFGKPSSPTPPTPTETQKQREKQTCPGLVPDMSRTAPTVAALSSSERISYEKELERIEEGLKAITNGASHDAWGPQYDELEKGKRSRLRNRKREILDRLGSIV